MYEYKVKEVVKVVDGDTVDIIIDLGFGLSKKERVRVAGVDTPEVRTRDDKEKALGADASQFAKEWFAEEGEIIVRTDKDGKYGRMLGTFFRGNECYNKRLVDEGFAFAYHGGSKCTDWDILIERRKSSKTWVDTPLSVLISEEN